ncbi:MAG: hypothetical protein AAFU67_19260, partial [Bacteroidota bacterium]
KMIDGDKAFLHFSSTNPAVAVDICQAMNNFTPGDLVGISGKAYNLGDPVGSNIPLLPINGGGIGGPLPSVVVEIAKSGRTNQLNGQIESITTYGDYQALPPVYATSILSQREAIDSILTDALSSGVEIPASQLSGLSLIDGNGNCTPIDADCFVRINNNQLVVLGPIATDEVQIVGTPDTPHPMVAALNNYLTNYYNFQLAPDFNDEDQLCLLNGNYILAVLPSSRDDVTFMQGQQMETLNEQFDCINNATHTISDFFTDVNIESGTALIGRDEFVPPRVNKSVVLKLNNTGELFGRYEKCGDNQLELCIMTCDNPPNCVPYNYEMEAQGAPFR